MSAATEPTSGGRRLEDPRALGQLADRRLAPDEPRSEHGAKLGLALLVGDSLVVAGLAENRALRPALAREAPA
jgi:hypothetical protein